MYPYDTPQFQDQISKLFSSGINSQQPIHVVKVNGRAGADSFSMPANSDTVLLDMNEPIAWFVMTDGAGYKTVTPYDLIPHKEVTQQDTLKSMEERITKLEEAFKHNGKSNFTTNYAKSNRPEQQHNDASNRSDAQR